MSSARRARRGIETALLGSTRPRRKTPVCLARRLLAALLLLVGASGAAHGAACVAIASGNWNAAGTWQSGTIPATTGDTASIGAYTVTLTANQSCGSITFTGAGTITGAFKLTTLGTITASGADTISTSQIDIGNATETLASGGASDSLTISAAIFNSSGTGNLVVSGSGTVTLGGNCTHSGTTTVSGGTLLVNGTCSTTMVLAGGTLGGTGTTGTVLQSAGAVPTVRPGSASAKGILTTGAMDLSPVGTPSLYVRVTGTTTAGTDFDRLALGGNALTLGGGSTLIVDVGGLPAAGGCDVVTAGSINGTFTSVQVVNGAATVSYTATTVHVAATVDTLVAEYKCDSTSGTTLYDTSGHGLNGTFSSSDFSWDANGGCDAGALVCNGTGYVSLPISPDLQPSSVGVSVWAKRTGGTWIGKANIFLWSKPVNWYDATGYYLEMWDVNVGTNSLAIWVDGDGTGSGRGVRYQNQTADTLFPLGQWVHLFYAFNSATHVGAIYRNGTSLGGLTYFNSPSTITKNTAARIIADIHGEIDLFRIYANPTTALIATLASEKRKVWNGGSSTGSNWSDGTNWVGGVAPSAGDNLVFSGAARTANTNDYAAGTGFRSITFTDNGFVLGGNGVTLTNGVLNDYGAGSNAVNLPITLAQAQTFTASASTTLTVLGSVATAGYTLTLDGEGAVTVNGVVSGTGNVASGVGGGTFELTAANTYSGTTTANGGFLRASNTVQASANGAFGNAASAIVLAGGSVQVNTATFSRALSATGGAIDAYGSARTVSSTIATTAAVQVGGTTAASAAGQTLTLTGVVSGAGGLTKIGTSTVVLGVGMTYTGPTTVSAGTLQCNAASRLPLVATSIASGATLDCNSFNQAIGTLTGAGTASLGSATLTVGGDNGSGTFSGVMSGTGGFAKTGTGTWTLGGASTFSGGATVSAGTVTIANNAALGTTAGATTVASGATLRWDGPYDIGAEPLTLNGTGVGGIGALYASTSGAAVSSGAITLAGSTRIGVDTWSMYLKGAIGGANALEKTGSGLLLLSGASTYTGATTVSAGTLRLYGDSGAIASSSGVTVASGATFDIGGASDQIYVEDAVPTGAVAVTSTDSWTWVSSSPTPYAGSLAHQSDIVAGGHQHYFQNAPQVMPVAAGDTVFAYVYLDPANPPSEIMIQWNDGSGSATQWEHRAYWGANDLGPAWGLSTQYAAGALPATGQWVRLEVPASAVGLEGFAVDGVAFALWDGRVTWDHVGRSPASTGTGAANPDRIGNSAAITLNGGALSLFAPVNVARSETFGQLVIGPGLDAITETASGTGSASLTASGNISRLAGGGTLSFTRGSAAPLGSLFLTGTANNSLLSYSTVTQATTTVGQYTTASGLVQSSSGTLYTSAVNGGNWNTNSTWTPSTGHPTASDDMVISNGHKIHSDSVSDAVRNVTYADFGQLDMASVSVSGVWRFLGSSTGGWIGVDLHYGATEAIFDHENAAGYVYFYQSQTLTGTGGVTKTGPGTFEFAAFGSYSGATTIDQGVFIASEASALGDTATGTTVKSAGQLEVNAVAIGAEPLTIAGLGANGDGTLRGNGVCSYGGAITLAADSAIGTYASSIFSIATAVGGGFGLTLNDSGTLILSGASTYTGATTLTGSGTVRLSADVIASANGPLGNASGAVTLDGSAIEVNTGTVSRSVAVTSLGGRIDAYGASRAVASAITGSTASGLQATFFAGSLNRVLEDDWRLTRAPIGKRVDQDVNWVNSFGTAAQEAAYGLTDSAGQWQAFSVQWDGWITVHDTCNILTRSDDTSRVWLDLNGNGAVDPGEWGVNGWGNGGQSVATQTTQWSVPPGTYRIRVQYEQGNGGDEMTLMWTDSAYSAGVWDNSYYIVPASCLSNQAWLSLGGITPPSPPAGVPAQGLIGWYFPQDLRTVDVDDWTRSYSLGGSRIDAPVAYSGASWGDDTVRSGFGISGSGGGAWTQFSVQWDGYLTVPATVDIMTASDDNSRVAIDLNGDGVFQSGEWGENNWSNAGGQGTTLRTVASAVPAGTYAIRVQYEQGTGGYDMYLLWSDSSRSAGTWTGTGGTGYIIPSTYLATGTPAVTTGQRLIMTGLISGSLDLRKTNTSTAVLNTVESYTGCTGVEGGTLAIGVANAIPSTSAVGVQSGATLTLNGFADTVASIAGSGSLQLGSARLTCGDASSTTFSGVVSGAGGGITKQGSGTLALSGTDTYSGASIVNAGTLEIDGSTASSAVTVNAGSLSGVGTVGAITADGGSVAPGNGSIGTLTGASATIGSGAKLHARIAGYTAGSTFDRLALGSGALTIEGATLELDLSSLASTGTAVGVVTCGSVIGKFASVSLLDNTGSYSASVIYNATSIDVVITAAPILWWKLDERAGTFITDSSGNGHNGTLVSGTWVPSGGAIDGALSLPSTTGSYAEGDTSSALSPPQLTFMCWVKRSAGSWSGRENMLFWAKASEDATSWTGAGWYVATKDKGTPGNQPPIYIDVDNSSGYSIADQSSDTFYPLNTWVHIAVAIDTTAHTCVMYKNGSPTGAAGTWGSGPWTVSSNSGRRVVGRISSGGTNWWPAADNEDDVRIYGTVLSANDIAGIYAAGRTSRVWTGAGGNANWSTAANWTDSVVPNSGDNLVFPSGALQTTNTDDIASGTYNSISFTGGGYSLGSNGVTLSNGVVCSTGSNTIALPLTLAANQTSSAASGATLTFSNLGTIANGGFRLYVDGAGTGAYGGVISGTGGVTKTGAGTATLSATNTYTGSTLIGEGELDLATTGSLSSSSAVTVSGGILGGTGTVGAITGTGGTIRPGTSGARGILKGGSTNLGGGGSVTIRIAALSTPGTDYDRLDLATGGGTLTLNGTSTLILDLSGLASAGRAANVITCSGFALGTFGTVQVVNNPNGWIADVDYSTSGGVSVTLRARRLTTVGLGAPFRF